MRKFDSKWSPDGLVKEVKRCAEGLVMDGITGKAMTQTIQAGSAYHMPTGSVLVYTEDFGYYPGHLPLPELNRCFHLMIGFVDPLTKKSLPRDDVKTKMWLEAFFPGLLEYVWEEGPTIEIQKAKHLWNYRIWATGKMKPILPNDVEQKVLISKGYRQYAQLELIN